MKISQLKTLTIPDLNDLLPILDINGGVSGKPILRKATLLSLLALAQNNNNADLTGLADRVTATETIDSIQNTDITNLQNRVTGLESNNNIIIPSTIKTVAADADYFIGIDSTGTLYKITKANLLAGLTSGGTTPTTDPYLSKTLLWLKGNGSNNSISITDSSTSARVITIAGNTKISTSQSKYGGSSIYFDGSGDYLSFALDMNFQEFTIESWIYPLSQFPEIFVMANSTDAVINNYKGLSRYSSTWGITKWGAGMIASYGSNLFTLNTWNHVALCRDNTNTTKCFVNGTQVGSNTTISESFSSPRIVVGFNASSQYPAYFNGYMDSYRVSNVSRYSSAFNPETDTYLA